MATVPPMIRVASIGECMIELRHRTARKLDLAYGGDTLNTAVYLARLMRGRNVTVDYVTALGDDPSVRSFGYLKQATIVARFEPGRLIVIRVYFTGQDWSRGPGHR